MSEGLRKPVWQNERFEVGLLDEKTLIVKEKRPEEGIELVTVIPAQKETK